MREQSVRYRKQGDRTLAPFISTDQWISLEMKRYIETTEAPGKYGRFGEVAE